MPGDALRGRDASDAELLAQVRDGNRGAFGGLYERHHDAALRLASRLTFATRVSAEDLVAEAFFQTLNAIVEGKGPTESFRAYLFTVLRNAATARGIDDARTVTIDDFEQLESSPRTEPVEQVDPVVTRYESDVVRTAFGSISERWQKVLWYCEVEGMKHADAARLLGTSSHGVAVLLVRAREGLKEAYLAAHLSAVPAGSACAKYARKLGGFGRGNLAARDRVKVESHLAGCPDCAAMAAEVKDVNRGLYILPFLLIGGAAAQDGAGGGVGGNGSTVPSAAGPSSVAPGVAPMVSAAPTVGAGWTSAALGNIALTATGAGAVTTVLALAVAASVAAAAISGSPALELGPPSTVEAVQQAGETHEGKLGGSNGTSIVPGAPAGGADPTASPPPTSAPVPSRSPEPGIPPEDGAATQPGPPPVTPVNLVANGGFESLDRQPDGSYVIGESFDGWVVTGVVPGVGDFGLQVWWDAPVAGPFPNGPYAGVQGSIERTIATVPGTVYRLTFEHRASGTSSDPANPGWQGGTSGSALIDGVVVSSFVTTAGSLAVEATFTATSTSTTLSFATTGNAAGIDNVSVLPR